MLHHPPAALPAAASHGAVAMRQAVTSPLHVRMLQLPIVGALLPHSVLKLQL